MPTHFAEFLPVRVRRTIYVLYGLLSVAVSATQVGYASIEGVSQPTWLTVAIAVTAFLAAPVTALAVTNTPAPRTDTADLPGVPHAEHLLSPSEQAKRQAARDELDYLEQQALARRDPTDVAVHADLLEGRDE